MFVKERKKQSSKHLIEKSHRYRGVNDLLSYLIALDDSTVLHKDGAISMHFRYLAPDLSACTDEELDFHASTWSCAFQFLGNGWMVETNVISENFSHYHQSREFPDIVSALIDDERRIQYQHGEYYKTAYYLSITWKPEQLIASKLRQFALDLGEQYASEKGIEETLTAFKKTVMTYTGFLKRSLLSLMPLKGDELTTYLYKCLTGSTQVLSKPYVGAFLDCYLSNEDFEVANH